MSVLSRSFKVFFIVLGLLLVVLLAFVVTFDAENYRPQIIAQVEKVTGREFTIGGGINLSIFPWVGLKVEDVSLGNEKGFSAEHFAVIRQLDVKVNVLPLLKKEVQINTIRLNGLHISLEVANDKSNNWSGLVRSEAPAEKTETAEKSAGPPPALAALHVQGVEFVDAEVNYDDHSTGTRATVSEVSLTTGEIQFDKPVAIELAAHIQNKQPQLDTRINLGMQLTFNHDFTEFDLADFIITLLVKANEFIPQDEKLEITSGIKVSMGEQRIIVQPLQLSVLDTSTEAKLEITHFLEQPLIQGNIAVLPFNARAVAGRAGVSLPAMARADALGQVALKTDINFQSEKLEANNLELSLDSSTLSGWLHVLNISKQQLRYDLVLDRIAIDDYLPPAAVADKSGQAAAGTSSGTTSPAEASANNAATGNEKIELPLELLRQLDIQGDFRIGALTAMQYDITKLLMHTSAKQGVIKIEPLSMQLLEGEMNSVVKLNAANAIPAYALKLDASKLQAGPVANPLLAGVMGEKPITVQGAVNLAMDVNTKGETVNQMKKAGTGKVVLDMNTTEVNGFDPEYYMRSSVASYIGNKGGGLSKTIMGSYEPREVTVFDKIHSTVKLANGKARTNDFLMDSLRVQIKADGFVDIMENSLDVNSSVRLPRNQTVLEKVLDEPMYVRIHGPFEALEYDIDTDRLKKSTTDVLEKEAKAKAKAKLEAEKRKAEEKAKQEVQQKADELKDRLKNKLKGLF